MMPKNDKMIEIVLSRKIHLSSVVQSVTKFFKSFRCDKNDKHTMIDDTHNVTQSLNRGYIVCL
jgi:hypothetical protein